MSDKAALRRYEQAQVDADIEGLARDPAIEAQIERWHAEGFSAEDCIERLKSLFAERQAVAAE